MDRATLHRTLTFPLFFSWLWEVCRRSICPSVNLKQWPAAPRVPGSYRVHQACRVFLLRSETCALKLNVLQMYRPVGAWASANLQAFQTPPEVNRQSSSRQTPTTVNDLGHCVLHTNTLNGLWHAQSEKEEQLHRLAAVLQEHETLTQGDIAEVLAGTFSRAPVPRVADPEADMLLGEPAQPLAESSKAVS